MQRKPAVVISLSSSTGGFPALPSSLFLANPWIKGTAISIPHSSYRKITKVPTPVGTCRRDSSDSAGCRLFLYVCRETSQCVKPFAPPSNNRNPCGELQICHPTRQKCLHTDAHHLDHVAYDHVAMLGYFRRRLPPRMRLNLPALY